MQTEEVKSGQLFAIAHIGCMNIIDTCELAKHAEQQGVIALSTLAPSYYKISDEETLL